MKVTLNNGMIVEGTLDQIQQVARTFGQTVPVDDGYHYNSSSKGLIRIADMETTHLRNALLKRYVTFVTNLKLLGNDRIATEISNPSDKTLVGLMAEFSRRKLSGRL